MELNVVKRVNISLGCEFKYGFEYCFFYLKEGVVIMYMYFEI